MKINKKTRENLEKIGIILTLSTSMAMNNPTALFFLTTGGTCLFLSDFLNKY